MAQGGDPLDEPHTTTTSLFVRNVRNAKEAPVNQAAKKKKKKKRMTRY